MLEPAGRAIPLLRALPISGRHVIRRSAVTLRSVQPDTIVRTFPDMQETTTSSDASNARRYSYGILKPVRLPDAERHNERLLGPMAFGIEVTEHELANRCGLGNLDPQHDEEAVDEAAVECALHAELPPTGARLVTIRPDADALSAMVILGLRRDGETISGDIVARVFRVGRHDRFFQGEWPGPGALPRSGSEIGASVRRDLDVSALSSTVLDAGLSFDKRLLAVECWLRTGALPPGAIDRVRAQDQVLMRSLHDGHTHVSGRAGGRIAVVQSAAIGALGLGYLVAPIVIAVQSAPKMSAMSISRKATIAQWKPGHLDLAAVVAELNPIEPGWGGSPTIIGSPQGAGSSLEVEQLVSIAVRHLAGGSGKE